jgi:hypothetical protein
MTKKAENLNTQLQPSLEMAGVISRSSFFDEIYRKPSQESIDKYERAFNARLAYEKNCIAKYDYPDWMREPSKPPIKGERMEDFACKFGTTIQEMKDCEIQVERALQNGL